MIKRMLYLLVVLADVGLILTGTIYWKLGAGLLVGVILLYNIIKRLLF